MRWTDKDQKGFYKGRNKGFNFTVSYTKDYNTFYIVASHQKKDIRFNTLWTKKIFETFELAEEFCETFDYKKHKCVGKNI